ncbi:hypothetical protein [Halocatena halophila]|uniref:hypothetical protein n=1 Tax=Halocatena halophila TaxID=2814576 RepID=UPI002ED01A7E
MSSNPDYEASTLSVATVRATLDDTEEKAIAEATIQRAIGAAEAYVATLDIDPNVDTETIEEAKIALAAFKTFASVPTETQKEALGVSKRVDVESRQAALKEQSDKALDAITRDFFSHTLSQ